MLIDFAEVKRLVSVWDVLDMIGWQAIARTPTERRGPCPIHGSTNIRSRVFAASRDGWMCHKCKRNGDAVRLWAELRSMTSYNAAVDLCKRSGSKVPYLPQQTLFSEGKGTGRGTVQ